MVKPPNRFRYSLIVKDEKRLTDISQRAENSEEIRSPAIVVRRVLVDGRIWKEPTKYEKQQRQDLMIYRLESELRMMTSVLEGYRMALKETKLQKASSQHRKRFPLRDQKPVYKDVKGSEGLVLY
ncbi:hypothetical protein F2Q70_00026614 [Brassica cretica]|uniref:Uncharacterized protein n=1 Tax=Brassica cretica TaxID=69181 RepID=A0A8S9LFI4_BRACR|nr:hypothetical protein F2Q70_00026614 [Brassica cretica]